MIAQVRLFWDEHSDSRFDDLDPLSPNPVPDRNMSGAR